MVVVVTVVLLLLSTTVPVVSGTYTESSGSTVAQSAVDTTPVRVQQTAPNNSSVVRHENPENEAQEGDLDAISVQLSRSLSSRLSQSSISISRAEYELAKQYVGEEYRTEAARYVEVAGETPNESDDRVAERFNRTAREQEQFADRLSEFNQTRERYRAAKQAGNESGARDLARELRRIADDLQRTRGDLVTNYNRISDDTSIDLSEETRLINGTVAQRTAEVQQVQDTEFEPTSLSVETTTPSPSISFADPAQFQGRLTASGEPLADRDIRLEIGTQLIETETDEDGRFTAEFRPVTTPVGTQQLDVTYIPQNQSDYQRSNDTVQVDISQVSPDVTVSLEPAEAQFNDRVRVIVTVSVDDVAVRTAPVTMYLAEERVTVNAASAETNETGRSDRDVQIPLNLPVGEQPVRVVVGNDTNAIGQAEARTDLTVLPTNATLAIATRRVNASATGVEQREVITQGRLTTENGTPIGGESVEISIRGTAITTVQTDRDGRFNTTIQVPAWVLPSTVGGEEEIRITATYANDETNLADTTTTSGVLFQAELLNVIGQNLSWSRTLTALAVLGSAVALRRQYDRSRTEAVPDTAMETPLDDSETTTGDSISLLQLSERWLKAGRTSAAVQFAYAAARARFIEVYDISPTETHWKFYQACRAASGADLDEFERLTALYERAAFAGHPVDYATAGEAYLLTEELRTGLDAEREGGTDREASPDSNPQRSYETAPSEAGKDD
jgi:rubrerythrin